MSADVTYQIEWLVPAEASVSGSPYWSAVDLGDCRHSTPDAAEARDLVAQARRNDPAGGPWRVVRVTREVMEW